MAQISKNKIIFGREDWMAGLNPNYSLQYTDLPIPSGNTLATSMSSFNAFRQDTFGYAAPGSGLEQVANVSTVSSSPLRCIRLAYDDGANANKAFAIDSNTKLFRMNASDGDIENAGSWPHTISPASGTAEANDLIVYTADVSASSAQRVYYSYNAVGDDSWDVGMYALDGSTFDDDFLSTVPATDGLVTFTGEDNPHPMIVGDDDIVYIGDGNRLIGYDGTTGSDGEIFLALVLPQGFCIQSFSRLNQRLQIYGYFRYDTSQSIDTLPFAATTAKCFFWDYLNLDPYDSVDLSDSFVTCAFQYQSTVGCFTQGRPSTTGSSQPAKLRIYNGSKFEVVATFDANGSNSQNALPLNGAYEVLGDCILWNSLGHIFQYGNPYPGGDVKLLKTIEGSGSSSGALRLLDQSTILFSTGTTTTGGAEIADSSSSTNKYNEGFIRSAAVSPSFPAGQVGNINSIKITYAKTSSNDGLRLTLYVIGNNLPLTSVLDQVTEVTTDDIVTQRYYNSLETKLPYFSDVSVALDWTGSQASDCPVVDSIEIEYDLVNLKAIVTE